MSSIYNFAPLQRYDRPHRNQRLMRRSFPELARKTVREAIVKEQYQVTVLDRDFLALADEWLADHPC